MANKLIILCGIPFSGKTTLAKQIANRKAYDHIDLDTIKNEAVGPDLKDEDIDQSMWDRIYQKMYQTIDRSLRRGQTVIHDTGNFTVYERSLINKIAAKLNIPYITVYVSTSTNIAYKRLTNNRITNSRFDITDKEFYDAVAEMQIPGSDEHTIVYNQNDDVEAWIAKNNI